MEAAKRPHTRLNRKVYPQDLNPYFIPSLGTAGRALGTVRRKSRPASFHALNHFAR